MNKMNEFILKEKHKYWDNKITLEEYIKNTEEDGYIDCSSDYEYEFWYILENLKKLNNLQSKIDKANKYLEEHTDKLGKIRIPKIDFNYNELSDILKEVE